MDDAFEALVALTNRSYTAVEGIVHRCRYWRRRRTTPSPGSIPPLRRTLNLQASFFAVDAAEENLRQRKAGHAPTLDAVASYQKGDNDSLGFTNSAASPTTYGGDVSQRSIGLQLNIPLYSGGLTSARRCVRPISAWGRPSSCAKACAARWCRTPVTCSVR